MRYLGGLDRGRRGCRCAARATSTPVLATARSAARHEALAAVPLIAASLFVTLAAAEPAAWRRRHALLGWRWSPSDSSRRSTACDRLRAAHPQRPPHCAARRSGAMVDIVRSNFGGGAHRPRQDRRRRTAPGSSTFRSTCATRTALAVLAMIVTSTPGTVWAELRPDGSLADAARARPPRRAQRGSTSIKKRYEQPLLEIFE